MSPSARLWISDKPLVLASRSRARKEMLQSAGIETEISLSEVDERIIESEKGPEIDPRALALVLAQAKALDVSARQHDRIVLGADQTLEMGGVAYAKASDMQEAAARLRMLSGNVHRLNSAFCFARNGTILHAGCATAKLTMRTLSDEFIAAYLDAAGERVLASVGVYEVESLGAQLFSSIEGDWHTILGLPLLQVIGFLQAEGCLRR